MRRSSSALALFVLALLAASAPAPLAGLQQVRRVDDAALRKAGAGDEWLSYGLDQSETRLKGERVLAAIAWPPGWQPRIARLAMQVARSAIGSRRSARRGSERAASQSPVSASSITPYPPPRGV